VNLTERLRGIVKPSSAVPAAASIPVACGVSQTQSIEDTLGGEWRSDGDRSCFVVEQRVDEDAVLGGTRVGDLANRLAASIGHASLLGRGAPARQPLLFFDLETTGLNGGAGTYAFLIGCGSFDARGGFVTKQYVMARYGDERTMLEVVAGELAKAGALVSFNGKSFDAPVIETRYLFHRLDWAGANLPHLDMLHPARRFWGDATCSLANLEAEILGTRRTADVPGFEIPARYFHFLRSGDPRPLAAVLDHNRRDLLSLAGLAARLLRLVALGVDEAADAREAVALGRLYAQAGLDAPARHALIRALEWCGLMDGHRGNAPLRIAALHALALCERRARRYDDAADRWRAMLEMPGCPAHLARQASEALAIHHEHRARDLSAARTFALRSLNGGSSAVWRDAVERRVTRINRKMNERSLLDALPV
jgi:hypothetical protein